MHNKDFSYIKKIDPEIFHLIELERERQQTTLSLVASENCVSYGSSCLEGSFLTNKMSEGYPGKRYSTGCKYIDDIEEIACKRAEDLFEAEHANLQSCMASYANLAVMISCLNLGDRILSMELSSGGHLTHGSPYHLSGKLYKFQYYNVDPKTYLLNYDEILKLARDFRPKLIICGATAYPRSIDFLSFRKIADEVGAYLLADISHTAGLVATRIHPNPGPIADFVTFSTHKTLRAPRGGGILLCKKQFAKEIDRAVFPGLQSGPKTDVIASRAVMLKESASQSFKNYQHQVVKNARVLSQELISKGIDVLTGGTDTHLLLIDLTNLNLTGKDAETLLESVGIITNRNLIPYDKKSARVTSGLRLGTPSLTARGMKEKEMRIIVSLIVQALKNEELDNVRQEVYKLAIKYTDGANSF